MAGKLKIREIAALTWRVNQYRIARSGRKVEYQRTRPAVRPGLRQVPRRAGRDVGRTFPVQYGDRVCALASI